MGIVCVYKVLSLYQINLNYILYSKGQGCYVIGVGIGIGCYMMGNDDLKVEISINKEIGLEFKCDGWLVGVIWFCNDYCNKIEVGIVLLQCINNGKMDVYQWENVLKVVVEGLEGMLNVLVSDIVNWMNNVMYMLQSKNKEIGECLLIILQYMFNFILSWQVCQDVFL